MALCVWLKCETLTEEKPFLLWG